MKIYKESGDKSLRVAGRIDFDVGVQNTRLVNQYLSPRKQSCTKEVAVCECTSHTHYLHQHCHCSCHGGCLPTKTPADLFTYNRSYLTSQIKYEPKTYEREDRQERSHRSYFIPTGFRLNPQETTGNNRVANFQFNTSKVFKSVDEELLNLQNRKESSLKHSREYAPPYKQCGEYSTKSTEAHTAGLFGSKYSIQPREESSFSHFKNRVLSTSYSKTSTSKPAREPAVYSDTFKSPAYRRKQEQVSNPSPETRRLMMNKLIEEMEGRLAKEKAEEERDLRERKEEEQLLEIRNKAKASALESEMKARDKSSQRKQREAEVRAATAALEREKMNRLRSSREKSSSGANLLEPSQAKQITHIDRERFERIEAEIERLKKRNLGTSSSLRSKDKPALINSLDIDHGSAAFNNEEITSRKERPALDSDKLKHLQNSMTKKNLEENPAEQKPRKLSSKLNPEDCRSNLKAIVEREMSNKSNHHSPRRNE